MALPKFTLFTSLPPELRNKIYQTATPPRIVHIEEIPEDKDRFLEMLRTRPLTREISSTLTHFAHIWAPHIQGPISQHALEAYGVSGARPLPQPWVPSPTLPEIPLRWLADHPEVAWELIREGRFVSDAPIPVLLHVWSESRAELMRWGYRLAFGTRSSPPRIWFNFERDILHLSRVDTKTRDTNTIFGDMGYDLGQFDPDDLKRVKRLALGEGGILLYPGWDKEEWWKMPFTEVLRLFGNVSELLLVDWEERDIDRWQDHGEHWTTRYSAKGYWDGDLCCVAVEEIDALLSLLVRDGDYRTDLGSVGLVAEMLKAHQQQEKEPPYFEYRRLKTERNLRRVRDRIVAEGEGGVVPWRVPTLRAVHILPSSLAPMILQERQDALRKLDNKQRRWNEAFIFGLYDPLAAANGGPPLETPSSPRWGLEFEDYGDVYDPSAFVIWTDSQAETNALVRGTYRAKRWWVQKGTVAEPGYEVF